MSLINEALKKTQQERKANRYEGIANKTSYDNDYTPHSPRSHQFFKYFVAITIALAVLGSAVIIAVALMHQSSGGSQPAEKSVEMQVNLANAPSEDDQAELAQTTVERPKLDTSLPTPTEAPTPTNDPASPSPADTAKTLSTFLQEAEITGVRLAGERSKVVLNQKIYKIGDVVLTEPTLRLHAVNAQEIVFLDELNTQHVKQY